MRGIPHFANTIVADKRKNSIGQRNRLPIKTIEGQGNSPNPQFYTSVSLCSGSLSLSSSLRNRLFHCFLACTTSCLLGGFLSLLEHILIVVD